MKSERRGTLVLLACHGVYDAQRDCFYAEHPEDRPVYESQLVYALNHLRWRADASALLVISGGQTKRERACSEARSYLDLAAALGLEVPENVALEEYSLTSVENVLLSLYVYHLRTGRFPERIECVSWEFKRERFQRALQAISDWPPLAEKWAELYFFPVGDLAAEQRARALEVEKGYIDSLKIGLDAYYQNAETQAVLRRRDVYSSREAARKFFAAYPLPF